MQKESARSMAFAPASAASPAKSPLWRSGVTKIFRRSASWQRWFVAAFETYPTGHGRQPAEVDSSPAVLVFSGQAVHVAAPAASA